MNLLIISDLHIGIKSDDDVFQWDEDMFIDLLSDVISIYEVDAVILNGDIYELYKHSYKDIKKVYPKLIEFLKHFVYIKGNHDMSMKCDKVSFDMINRKGISIHIEHGHLGDFMNGTKIGRVLGKIFFKFLKLAFITKWAKKVYLNYIKWDDDHIPRKYNRLPYLNYALKLLKEYDVVILGHTHKMETVKTFYDDKRKMYLNTGTCSKGKFQGIVLDTETLDYKTIKLRKE